MLKSDTPASLACVVEYSLLSGYSRPSATKHVRERGRGVVTGKVASVWVIRGEGYPKRREAWSKRWGLGPSPGRRWPFLSCWLLFFEGVLFEHKLDRGGPTKGPPLWTLFDVPRCRAHPDDSLARINLVPSLLYLSFFMSLAT